MSRWWSHSLLKSLVVVGYLLATTASGLFHDHGEAGHSCSSGCCSHVAPGEKPREIAKTEQGNKCRHCSCKHHIAKKDQPKTPTVTAGHPEHGPCAVCQFLAQHHAVNAPEAATEVVGPPPAFAEVARILAPASRTVTHPARGPPACA